MVSQQFVDYIKRQLATGVAREDIKKALVINGLSEQDIAEGFALAVPQSIPLTPQATVLPTPTTPAVPVMNERPRSVLYFELLMYAAIGVSIIGSLISSRVSISMLSSSYAYPVLLAIPTINILVVWLAAHRRVNWARIVLLALFLANFLGLFGIVAALFTNPTLAFTGFASVALEIAAFCFAFSSTSNQWFAPQDSTPAVPGQAVDNTIWRKGIPGTNIGFMVVSLLLVFGLDLSILYGSNWSLLPFWIEMLVVLGIFGIFFYVENFSLKKRFANSRSTLDTWISAAIVIRNIAFVLNFIPLIQIAGAAALVFGGIPFLILYSVLLAKRSKVS